MNQLLTGKFISQKRKEKNLTQEQLAEKLGVSNKTISKWENGKCMPDYSVVKSLCEELEITVAFFISELLSSFTSDMFKVSFVTTFFPSSSELRI